MTASGEAPSVAAQRLVGLVAGFGVAGFAVLDGAQFDDLPAALRQAGLLGRSLFLDQGDAELERAGPWLVTLAQAPDAADHVFCLAGAVIGAPTGPGAVIAIPSGAGAGAVVGGAYGAVTGVRQGVEDGREWGRWLSEKIEGAQKKAKAKPKTDADTDCADCKPKNPCEPLKRGNGEGPYRGGGHGSPKQGTGTSSPVGTNSSFIIFHPRGLTKI
ncbi:DUF4123 domain-containing protein [Methylobacterium indicum]|uniref:DUF4123 domain-containing protein n=1 Tax=Methylobacterium indicum TaxID=1775910 RepID=UPI002435E13A|nr:DUF4123 domain-containing protein [Methylobacterium indicum]